MARAEEAFRAAFERLKQGQPTTLPKGTPLSQNNVAKEAGCDPSALRKSRFPTLVSEIQRWVAEHGSDAPPSPRQKILAQRRKNLSLRAQIESLKVERDHAFSLLVEADAKIADLMTTVTTQAAKLDELSNITPISSRAPKAT